jgi:hypothetical protein
VSYVKHVLQPGETIRYQGSVHWIVKIESVDVDQSVLGRLLDYGVVTIRGTGTTFEPLPLVERPIDFRNQVIAT